MNAGIETLSRYPADVRAVRIAYGKIPGNRLYACDAASERQLVSLWRAGWRKIETRSSIDDAFVELLDRVAVVLTAYAIGRRNEPGLNLTQVWRPQAEEVIPELPSDAITQMAMANPYGRDDAISLASQQILEKRMPILARHLHRLAKDGGFSALYFFEQLDAKTKREVLKNMKYSEKQHLANPFLVGEPNNTELGRWLQAHDGLTAQIYRLESLPVRLPWGVESFNLGAQGELFDSLRSNPTRAGIDGSVILDAKNIDEALVDALRRQAADEATAAARRAEELGRRK